MNDRQMEIRIRTLRSQEMAPQRRYYFPLTGYNYRLTNVACALLCAQIERREQTLERRRQIFAAYQKNLAGITGIGFQPVAPCAKPSPWLFYITVDEEKYG